MRYIERVEGWDHRPGKYSGGLRTLEEASQRYVREIYGDKSVGALCLRRDPDRIFPLEQLSAARREKRTCRDRHPGLCRFEHREVYGLAKHLASDIFNCVNGLALKPGVSLVKIAPSGQRSSEAKLWWLMRRVMKPRRLFFCEAALNLVNGQQFVDIKRPLVRATNYAIAAELMSTRIQDEQWTLRVVRHRSDRGPLWRTLQVGESEPRTLSCVKQPKVVLEEDALEAAMEMACGPGQAKRRRVSKKGKPQDDAMESEDASGGDESSSSSELVVAEPQEKNKGGPARQAAAAREAAFFHRELGIKRIDASHPGKAKCRVCSVVITKGQIRAAWAWNQRRPEAYVHAGCLHRMEEPEAMASSAMLPQVAIPEGPHAAALRADLSLAIRMLDKRLPRVQCQYYTNTFRLRIRLC